MNNSNNLRWLMRQSKYSIGVLCIIPLVCLVSSLCHIGISMIFKGYMDIAIAESSTTFLQMTIFSITIIIVFAFTHIASIESINLFKETIQNLSKGKICIIVTHDANIASICDTVYRLEEKHLTLLEEK